MLSIFSLNEIISVITEAVKDCGVVWQASKDGLTPDTDIRSQFLAAVFDELERSLYTARAPPKAKLFREVPVPSVTPFWPFADVLFHTIVTVEPMVSDSTFGSITV